VRSGRSWQKPRPGSRGRPERSRPDLRIRERSPGRASRGHHVPGAGGLHQRLLRVAEASRVEAGAGGRRLAAPDPHDPRGVAAVVRRAAGVRRAARRWRRRGSGSGREADAACGPARHLAAALRFDDAARRGGAACARSRRAPLRGRGAEPALGGGHHLHPDLGGLPVPGRGARRVEPQGRGLDDGHAPAHRTRARGSPDGDPAAASRKRDPSQRPGLPG
jgi:hypothetical protein